MRLELLHRVDSRLLRVLTTLTEQGALIMAQLDDLQVALRGLDGKIDTLIMLAQVKPTDLTTVLDQVAALDAKVTAVIQPPA